MSKIKEMLAQRKIEIKELQAKLKQELAEINMAEAAMASDDPAPAVKTRKRRSKTTLKDMIKAVLSEQPDGADSFKILEMIKERYGKEILRESLSPQLSRLKNDDKILELRGSNWFLLPEKNEAPLGASSDDVDASSNINEPLLGHQREGGDYGSL